MATRRKMENDITEVLCCSVERCLALRDLQFYLGPDEDTLEDGLAGLVRNKVLNRKGRIYCYLKPIEKRPVSLHERRLLVATHVSKAKEARTTGEIATACGLNSNQVYQICKRFEEKGFFEKGEPKPSTKRQFFAVIIRQIMHHSNYKLIRRQLKVSGTNGDGKVDVEDLCNLAQHQLDDQ